jgi:hypothetical protein
MSNVFQIAKREKVKLRMAIAGPSGSGKSYSGLLIASGIEDGDWSKIAVIDTEQGSAALYSHLGPFGHISMNPPYSPDRFIKAMKTAEEEGFKLIIIDSASAEWEGEGGILEQHGRATDTKYRGNPYRAWGEFTPIHKTFIHAIMTSKCHVICTFRSKTEYLLTDNAKGKQEPKKVGLAPIARPGTEYEFTLMIDLDLNHVATVSKDRTSLFDGTYNTPTADMGRTLAEWLNGGDPDV